MQPAFLHQGGALPRCFAIPSSAEKFYYSFGPEQLKLLTYFGVNVVVIGMLYVQIF